jgi:hypothetical protein
MFLKWAPLLEIIQAQSKKDLSFFFSYFPFGNENYSFYAFVIRNAYDRDESWITF